FDLFACLGVLSFRVQRPSVSFEGVNVPPARILNLRNPQRFIWSIGVIGVVEDQFAIGVVGQIDLAPRLLLEFRIGGLGFIRAPDVFKRLGQRIEILCVRRRLIALVQQFNRFGVLLLRGANLGQIAQRIVITGKE